MKSFDKKEQNKKAVYEHFGLKYNPDRPLIALISRLVDQKGIDLIRDMQDELQNLNADFIFMGSGNNDYENLFIWLSNNTKISELMSDMMQNLLILFTQPVISS